MEFESCYELAESVERLKAATRRSVFSAMGKQEAVGTVKESLVSLQRVIPLVGNSFKPFYRGRFIERDGKVILTGRFGMHWLAKAFMTFWFGGIACFIVIGLFTTQPNSALFPLFGLGMVAAGVAITYFGKWLARNDAAWLSNVIQDALGAKPSTNPENLALASSSTSQSQKRPTVILVTASALMILGLISLLTVSLGAPRSFPYGPHSSLFGRFNNEFSRYFSVTYGVCTLVLAIGIYHQRVLAWRAGIVFLALAWIVSVVGALETGGLDNGGVVFFCVGSLIVAAFWIRWWYAQRMYFHDRESS